MRNIWKHFCTVTRHRHLVFCSCCRAGIPWRGLVHDLSKYGPTEFWTGVKYYQGTRSPNEAEREANGYSAAWMHHKGCNRHHFEYWTDYDPAAQQTRPVRMPERYVVEMFCDRVAASRVYSGRRYTDRSALDYFLHSEKHRVIHPETSQLLEQLLRTLAEAGEQAAYREARSLLKK